MKKILAINYSQSGQLHRIMSNFFEPFEKEDVDRKTIEPKTDFPFPWTMFSFFNEMPETVLEKPIEIKPIDFKHEKYDLVVIGYQPWFLSPSRPLTGLFSYEPFKQLLKDTPVITVIGSRNMWLNSQEVVRDWVRENGAKLVGNLVYVDRHSNLPSAVSIVHWMMTGKQTKKWGIFPVPGVSEADVLSAADFGGMAHRHLEAGSLDHLQEAIIANKGIVVNTNLMFIEGRAKMLFRIWAKLITKKTEQGKNRKAWVNGFKYYLLFALFIVAPIVLLFYNILVRPFTQQSIKRKKQYFCQTNN